MYKPPTLPAPSHTVIYKRVDSSHDTVEIPMDVYVPSSHASTSPSLRPLIWLHTGGFLQGSRTFLPAHMLRACNRLNLVLVAPDYRLAPQVDMDQVMEDVTDAIQFTLAEQDGLGHALGSSVSLDRSHYLLAGSSAGGWAALLQGLGFIEDRRTTSQATLPAPLAVLAIYPVTTIAADRAPYLHRPLKPLPWAYKPDAQVGDEIPHALVQPHLDRSAPVVTEAPPWKDLTRGPLYSYARQEGIYAQLVLPKGTSADRYCLPSLIEQKWSGSQGSDADTQSTPRLVFIAYGDADKMVEVDQSEQVLASIQKSACPFTVGSHVEPGKNHLWDINEAEADLPTMWQQFERVLAQHP